MSGDLAEFLRVPLCPLWLSALRPASALRLRPG